MQHFFGRGWRMFAAGIGWTTCMAWAGGAGGAPSGSAPDPQGTREVAILVYHRFAETAEDSMTVRTQTFEAQLRFLREHGYQFVPLRDVVAWLRAQREEADGADANAPASAAASASANVAADVAASAPASARTSAPVTLPLKAVALTVDDGHHSVYDVMLPIVQREHLPVTLFVYPSAVSNAPYALTWNQLRTLHDTGLFDVQSHTWWHPNFNVERRRQAPEEFRRFVLTQFRHSRERIEAEVGTDVDMLAWPFGLYDEELMTLAREAGYQAAFTLEARKVTPRARMLAMPRFLMVDACTPAVLARLLGETVTPAVPSGESAR